MYSKCVWWLQETVCNTARACYIFNLEVKSYYPPICESFSTKPFLIDEITFNLWDSNGSRGMGIMKKISSAGPLRDKVGRIQQLPYVLFNSGGFL